VNAPIAIDVTDGLAERLPAADASLAAAVFTFTLCTIRRAYRSAQRPTETATPCLI
jgi:hypothetical protein